MEDNKKTRRSKCASRLYRLGWSIELVLRPRIGKLFWMYDRMDEEAQDAVEHLPITELTAEIVGAYVGHDTVATTDLPSLITTVGKELAGLGQKQPEPEEENGNSWVTWILLGLLLIGGFLFVWQKMN